MNRIAAVAVALVSSLALAQEIGKEITPDQANQPPPPPATQTPTYDNPYAPPPTPPPTPAEAKPAEVQAAKVAGPRKGAFGIRATFGGQSLGALATGAGAGPASGSFGFKYFATESVGITFDLGLGLGLVSGNVPFGFSTGLGIDAHLGSPEKPIRPFVTGGVAFGKAISTTDRDFFLSFNVGGGAEYWLSDYFSFNGRLLLGVPIDISGGSGAILFATFTPGVGATFYF